MGVPGAALICAPLHLAAMDGTPAGVHVVGGLQRWWGGWLPRAIPCGARGGLGLQRRLYRRGDLLVEAALLHLSFLLSLLLAGGQVGFAAVQDVLEPGQAHGGPPLELQVV